MFRRLILSFAALALLPVSMMVLLSDDERALSLLRWAVHQQTPYTLDLRDAEIEWSPIRIQAPLLLLQDPRREGPPLISAQNLDLQIPLAQLLFGQGNRGHLTATNLSYYLEEADAGEPIDLQGLLAPLTRLPRRADVDSVHLIAGQQNLWIFPLLQVQATRDSSGRIDLEAQTQIGQRRVSMSAESRWSEPSAEGLHLSLAVQLGDASTASQLLLSGDIHALGASLDYDFAIHGHYTRVSDFVLALDAEAYPFSGDLQLKGQLGGNLEGYRLALEDVTLTTPEDYRFSAAGTLTSANGPVAIALDAVGEAERLDAVLPIPGPLSRHLSHSTLELGVTGTLDRPIISRADVVLSGVGESALRLSARGQNLPLGALRNLADPTRFEGRFSLESATPSLITELPLSLTDLSASGTVVMTDTEVRLRAEQFTATLPAHALTGSADLLWRNDTFSAPRLTAALTDHGGGSMEARGTIADIGQGAGLALQVSATNVSVTDLATTLSTTPELPELVAPWRLTGQFQLLNPGALSLIRDADLRIHMNDELELRLAGNGRLAPAGLEGDLELQLATDSAHRLGEILGLPIAPSSAHGRLRLRPSYATLLADVQLPGSTLQATVTAALEGTTLQRLDADVYTPHLEISDLLNDGDKSTSEPFSITGLEAYLPPFPTNLSLRTDRLTGPMSELNQVHIAAELRDQRILLRKLDADYDGGELILRGVADLGLSPPAFSVAGRGIRVPLGTLTRDFQLQQTVDGAVSLRIGLATRGSTPTQWRQQLNGSLALALNDTTISGAAYDLLMSNLLAWLVSGAGQKTSTFDCTMARFDFTDGVGRSDSLYLETPRMLATGKGRIDLAQSTLDLRLEPRSKTRTFQFPSAVRIRGDLSDPGVSVSPLQTTADLSAQALLLIPSLALKLFGLKGLDEQLLPCSVPAP